MQEKNGGDHKESEAQMRKLSMSPLHRAFMTELGRTGVSDPAFTLALVLMRMLNAANYRSISVYTIGQESGLSMRELRRALEELVAMGALDMQKSRYNGRPVNRYRLGKAVMSRTGLAATFSDGTEGAPDTPEM